MQSWITLSKDGRSFKADIQLLHHAAQFVAMVSNSFLPPQQDDSQNNFQWNHETKSLEGNWIENPMVRTLLDVENFELIVDKYLSMEIVHLDGWTKEQVIGNLREALKTASLDSLRLKPISQFSLPSHAVDSGLPFAKPSLQDLKEWSAYLSNSQFLFDELRSKLAGASKVKVWPHHFDMGFYFAVLKDGDGQTIQSVGLGLAIPDEYVDEPYFYINHWSKNPIEYPEQLPEACGGYWNTKDWHGLVLPASAVMAQDNQCQFVRIFFNEGIHASLQVLNQNTSIITP